VFASAARAPLTSLASVVEMTGDYTLTLPVMLAVALATVVSRALSYGTIYTTKLLRRGIDIDHAPAVDPFEDLTAADAMRPIRPLLAANPGPANSAPEDSDASLPGPVTRQAAPQVLFANESLAQAARQVVLYGRDGLPVLSTDGQQVEGWLTSTNVLQAIARYMASSGIAADLGPGRRPGPDQPPAELEAPEPLPGYQVVEVTVAHNSEAVGRPLGKTNWPPGWVPVSVLDHHALRDPDPVRTLAPGDRVNLLAPTPPGPSPQAEPDDPRTHASLSPEAPALPPTGKPDPSGKGG
jgi:chloride channel protein, CIC family